MPIVFSRHYIVQIKRRKISRKMVLNTVKSPEKTISSFRNRKLRRSTVGDKLLEVVTKTEGSRITIITAYYLED